MKKTNDIRWLSGWLEGEGSFHMKREFNKLPRPCLQVSACDKDVVERGAEIMQNAKIYLYPQTQIRLGRQPLYRIHLVGRKAAEWMMTVYSLMGKRRQERIREIISEWQTLRQPMTRSERASSGGFAKHTIRGRQKIVTAIPVALLFLIAGCTSFVKASVDSLAAAQGFLAQAQVNHMAECTANPSLQFPCVDINLAVAAENAGVSALEAYCQLPVAPDPITLQSAGATACNENPTAKQALVSALANIGTVLANYKAQSGGKP